MTAPRLFSGRIGEPQEFFEFRTKNANFIAQESGGHWFVYRCGNGKDESVCTFGGIFSKTDAIAAAALAALAEV